MRIPLIVVGCSAHVIEDHICFSFFAGELSYHDAMLVLSGECGGMW